jgi:hypothetical protein
MEGFEKSAPLSFGILETKNSVVYSRHKIKNTKNTNMSTLRKQFEAFDKDIYLDYVGNEDRCFNFYDWFCKETSLKNKASKLFPAAKRFAQKMEINLDTHYVFFKNNCPINGSLYDDFRIVDIETGDVVFTVIPKCGHSGKTEVWGAENDFKEPLFKANTLSEIYKNLTPQNPS